jgi:pilus assembly protein FimV
MALALLAPGFAAALGVGDYELNSYLNQPLDMRVKLSNTGELAADEIVVTLASDEDYQRSAAQRSQLHSRLNFEVKLDDDAQTGTLHITTDKPVREPYINFLSEVLWPTGRILREFTVLLDPPTQEQQEQQQAQPAEPETSQTEPETTQTQPEQQQQTATRDQESVSRPVEPREPAEPARSEAASQPADTSGAEPEERRTYTVKSQDTMWQLALDYRPDSSVSVQQMLSAIKRLNQDAFIDGNVNLVREGAVLRIPTQREIRAINTREAMEDLATQNRKWREMLSARGIEPEAAPLQGTPATAEGDDGGRGDGEVQLVTESGESSSEGSGAGGEGSADSEQLENELAIREEKLDRLERENDELSSRLDDLEEQVDTSEQLLQLREQKIARLQDELKKLSESEDVDVADDLMEPVDDTQTGDTAAAEDASADEQPDDATTPAGDADAKTAEAGPEGEKPGDGQAGPDKTSSSEGQPGVPDETAASEQGQDVAGGQTGEGANQAQDDEAAAETAPAERAGDQQTTPGTEPGQQPSLVERILNYIMGNLVLIGVALLLLIALVVAAVLMLRRGQDQGLAEGPLVEAEADDDFLPSSLMDEDEDEFGAAADEQGGAAGSAGEGQDPLEEADLYVVYGRHQQAVDYLRGEIEKAPERTDLKIRQLDILAELQDNDSFEKEAANLAGTDPEVDSHIDTLRSRLGSAGDTADEPSLDDLEMDLSSGLDEGSSAPTAAPADEPAESTPEGDELESLDEFGDFDLSLDEDAGSGGSAETSGDEFELDLGGEDTETPEDNSIDFEPTSGGASAEELTLDSGETASGLEGGDDAGELEFSLEDLDTGEDAGDDELLDLGEEGESASAETSSPDQGAPAETRSDEEAAREAGPALDLDDSFDFEVESGGDTDTALNLDDEDNVSLEFSETSEEPSADELDLSLDDLDTGETDATGDAELNAALGELETPSEEPAETPSGSEADLAELDLELDQDDSGEVSASVPPTDEATAETGSDAPVEAASASAGSGESEAAPEGGVEAEPEGSTEAESAAEAEAGPEGGTEAGSEAMGADELLSEDDDFDFLGDSDENATKLDLAKAYIDMGDNDGARDILNEVLAEGTESQQGEARELLSQVG